MAAAGCAKRRRRRAHEPLIEGRLQRKKIARTNDYQQAGERYGTMPAEERDDLVTNLCAALGQCEGPIKEKVVWHFAQCDAKFGSRIAAGIGAAPPPAARKPVAAR